MAKKPPRRKMFRTARYKAGGNAFHIDFQLSMLFNMEALQKTIAEVAKLKPEPNGKLDLTVAFEDPGVMTQEELQERVVKEVNKLLANCGSKLRFKLVKWCDANRKAGETYGHIISDFLVSEGNEKGDVTDEKAYVLADEDQTNDEMAVMDPKNIRIRIQFKEGVETMTMHAFFKDFGELMDRLGYKIDRKTSVHVPWVQGCVSQFVLNGKVFVPMIRTYGSKVLCLLFTSYGGIAVGIASGHQYNCVLVHDLAKQYLLQATRVEETCEDDNGKRERDEDVFIAEGVGPGWFAFAQVPLEEVRYADLTRSICAPKKAFVHCCIERGPEASYETLESALKKLPEQGLTVDEKTPVRIDFFQALGANGKKPTIEDAKDLLEAQLKMYNALNATAYTRKKLQQLGAIGFSAMTEDQIEFLKRLGCSTGTMTLSDQKEGFELINNLDQLFEAFTVYKIMTKYRSFAQKILEKYADDKPLALELGKELLKAVAANPDTAEAKFAEVLESKNC